MSDIKWPKGKDHAYLIKEVGKHIDVILNGTFIAIDPASITLGYAVSKSGIVTEQGEIALNARAPINHRLQELVTTLQNDGEYGILAIERIRGNMAHAYLKFSVRVWWARRPFPIDVSEEERNNIIIGRLQKILDELESIEDNINE